MSLGLPPVSSGLRSIAPYLQRAEELVEREPVVAYWCAYYAAQLGITLKAQDPKSRTLLLNLLDALERLKKEIGPNDAIDIEPASAAYVENFALRVFNMADDEDRAGKASKSTAKKFLAAANFFEVLGVFPKTDVSESIEGKLKYAKWKAADIAKAFREGKRPTPGPADAGPSPDLLVPVQHPPTPPRPVQREPSPPTRPSSRSPKRQSPLLGEFIPGDAAGLDLIQADSSIEDRRGRVRFSPSSSPSKRSSPSFPTQPLSSSPPKRSSPPFPTQPLSSSPKRSSPPFPVQPLSSSPPKRSSPLFSAQPLSSSPPKRSSPPFPTQSLSSPLIRVSDLPPGFVPAETQPYAPAPGPFIVPPPPHMSPPMASSSAILASPPMDPIHVPPYPPPPPRQVELTPKLVAKAQKHCKFAISALDYEDTQHAIRELKAALETLGVSV